MIGLWPASRSAPLEFSRDAGYTWQMPAAFRLASRRLAARGTPYSGGSAPRKRQSEGSDPPRDAHSVKTSIYCMGREDAARQAASTTARRFAERRPTGLGRQNHPTNPSRCCPRPNPRDAGIRQIHHGGQRGYHGPLQKQQRVSSVIPPSYLWWHRETSFAAEPPQAQCRTQALLAAADSFGCRSGSHRQTLRDVFSNTFVAIVHDCRSPRCCCL